MSHGQRAVLVGGIVLGVLYLIELFIGTGPLAVVWPIVGGALAAFVGSREEGSLTVGRGVTLGAGAGLLGGAILVGVGSPFFYLFLASAAEPQIASAAERFGIASPMGSLLLIVGIVLVYALIGLALATASGGLGALLLRGRTNESPVRR